MLYFQAKFESFHRENSKHYSTITDLEASKPQRLSAPVISTNVSERVPIPHRNSAPQLLQEHSPSGFFHPKDNVILEAPPPEHIFVQNVSPQHSLSEPQLAERGGLEGADSPERAPRPHVNKWKRTSQQTRTLPPLPPRHYLRGADRLHRNVLHVRPPSDSLDQVQVYQLPVIGE